MSGCRPPPPRLEGERAGIEKCVLVWESAIEEHPTAGVFDEDARYNFPERERAFDQKLRALCTDTNGLEISALAERQIQEDALRSDTESGKEGE
jgi:hypothetical protein